MLTQAQPLLFIGQVADRSGVPIKTIPTRTLVCCTHQDGQRQASGNFHRKFWRAWHLSSDRKALASACKRLARSWKFTIMEISPVVK